MMITALIVGLSVVCLLLLAACIFLFDGAIRGGYANDSLTNTQSECRILATFIPSNISPDSLKTLAEKNSMSFSKSANDGFFPDTDNSTTVCSYGNLHFFFDSQSKLIDIRGHLLEVSLLH